MTTSGHFADTRGLTGREPNLTNCQSMVACAERKLVVDRFHQSLPGEVHVTSQSNMFTGRSKAEKQ